MFPTEPYCAVDSDFRSASLTLCSYVGIGSEAKLCCVVCCRSAVRRGCGGGEPPTERSTEPIIPRFITQFVASLRSQRLKARIPSPGIAGCSWRNGRQAEKELAHVPRARRAVGGARAVLPRRLRGRDAGAACVGDSESIRRSNAARRRRISSCSRCSSACSPPLPLRSC